MNRKIFPSGGLLLLQQNCRELVCWASLFGAERPVMEGALWSVWKDVSIKMSRRAYRGKGGIAPLSLKLGTRWRWLVSMTLRPLYPRVKSFLYPLSRRRVGRMIWDFLRTEKSLVPAGTRTPSRLSRDLSVCKLRYVVFWLEFWDYLNAVFRPLDVAVCTRIYNSRSPGRPGDKDLCCGD
jgi:hypothetical protein